MNRGKIVNWRWISLFRNKFYRFYQFSNSESALTLSFFDLQMQYSSSGGGTGAHADIWHGWLCDGGWGLGVVGYCYKALHLRYFQGSLPRLWPSSVSYSPDRRLFTLIIYNLPSYIVVYLLHITCGLLYAAVKLISFEFREPCLFVPWKLDLERANETFLGGKQLTKSCWQQHFQHVVHPTHSRTMNKMELPGRSWNHVERTGPLWNKVEPTVSGWN